MPRQPNILLILTDHWRGDSLGRTNPVVQTPHLDGLTAQGVNFTRAYTPSPSCTPARRALMTGMTPTSAGMVGYADNKPWDYTHTLAGELGRHGYQTMNVGKTHFYPERLRLGFHELVTPQDYETWIDREIGIKRAKWAHGVGHNTWFSRPNHLPEYHMEEAWFVDRAIDMVDKRDPTMPFFLCLSFNGPHPPWAPPQVYYDMFIDREIPQPVVGAWAQKHERDGAGALTTDAWRGRVPDHLNHQIRAAYYAYLAFLDAQIGRLFEAMGNLVDDNCLIAFTSDHGEMLGDHNLWRKTYGYESSARIPLIVRPPIDQSQFETTRRQMSVPIIGDMLPGPHDFDVEQLVGLEDLMPTLLDAADAPIPDTVEGRSLMPLVRGEQVPWREFYHIEHSPSYVRTNANQTLTDAEWKYIWNPITGEDQLFHIQLDPLELDDLAASNKYHDRVVYWRRRLAEHLKGRPENLSDGEHLKTGHVSPWR